ncbi:PAS domain S-box protein [Romboutsia sp.]|uniref:PAS domain S-box protein n=1 Tax=Romboutsia sp. TaxID=1965302 RepID=UPI003F3A7340
MENILETIDNYIIILDKKYNIKFCNKRILFKLGYQSEELKNINIKNIFFNKNKSINIDIDNITKNKKLNISLELLSKCREKISVYSEVIIDTFKGEESIIIVSKDICEKSYKREELEKILESILLNCWLKNMDGEYVYVNESYAKELGDNRLNILGKKTGDYWDNKQCSEFTDMDREVIESRKYQLTENYSKQDDSELWVEIYKAPIINENNEVEYIVGFTKDITLQKKLENEMYINAKKINNLNNILMKNNTNNSMYDLLNNITENILNHFECDGVSLLLVNRENSYIDININSGLENKYKLDERLLKIKVEELDNLNNHDYVNNIININDIDDEVLKNHMQKNSIENMGVYNMKFNNETIGFLVLKFLKNNTVKFNKIDYLKTVSENLATMIKSHTLSKEMQEEFEKRKQIESELELLLDISVDLISRGNINGEIKYINSNWHKALGWTESELLSMNILDIIHSEFKKEYKEIIKGLREDTGYLVSKLICKDGSYKWVELNYKILRNEEKFIITAKDLSEQRKQEEEKKILEKAIQMESLKNEFFANISHEFRTPLNIILGTMQLMQKNVENKKITWDESLNLESHINYIKQNSYRLLRLVNNLIDITSIESGYYQLQLGNYNIVDIVENITLSVAQYTREQGINLIFDTNCEEKIIACDPEKIERVVLNLLSNATKYTDANGCIYVDLQIDDEIVKVSVKDNGVGISKDKLDVIFDRFKKIDNSLNRKCEGSGIGLSLVKSLVELQNGSIYVDSELGVGTEFIFELPVRIIDDTSQITLNREISKSDQIEKCNIEFSDIYS